MVDRVCEQCEEQYDGNWNQRFCSPTCREVNKNKKSQQAWVTKKKYKPSEETRRAFDRMHVSRKSSLLKKFNAVRG